MPQSISNIQIRPNKTVPLSAIVSFESDCPVATTLTISDGKNQWTLDYDTDRNPADGLPVLGMRAGRAHTISISTQKIGGSRVVVLDPLPFVTPPLPQDPLVFPPMQVNAVVFEITLRNDADEPNVGWVCFGAERIREFRTI